MRRSAVTIPLALSLLSATSTAQPAASITQLINQLGSDDYRARQSASDSLVEQGEAVRPQIERLAIDPSDVERRNLAAGILAKLDRIARLGPTLIAIHAHAVDAQLVLKDVAAQAKISVRFGDNVQQIDRATSVTIDIDRRPFWLAVGQLCTLTHTHPTQADITRGIELDAGRSGNTLSGTACTAGPFVVAFKSVSRHQQKNQPVGHSLALELFVDPRAQPIELPIVTVDQAFDQAGHTLLAIPARSRIGFPGRGHMRLGVITPLNLASDSNQIKKLHGTVTATFAIDSQTATIVDVAAALHRPVTAGPFTVEVLDFRCDESSGQYTLAFHRSTPGPLQLNGLQMVDATGAVLSDSMGTVILTGAAPYTMTGSIHGNPPIKMPVSLKWTVPIHTETVHEPFELEDLPLP